MNDMSDSILTFDTDTSYQAVIRCPQCGTTKLMEVDPATLGKRKRFSCQCGEVFRYKVELRTQYRKKVNLPGTWVNPETKASGDMIIADVSISGIGMKNMQNRGIRIGDFLDVHFQLPDHKKSQINRRVEVRSVNDTFVGTQFCDGKEFDSELGFYIREQ